MGTNYYWYPAVDDEDVKWLRAQASATTPPGDYDVHSPIVSNRLRQIADRLELLLTATEPIHIGKSSAGWQFCFQTYEETSPPIRSWAAWQELLKTGVIKDEYGKVVTLDDLRATIEAKRSGKNHTNEVGGRMRGDFNDDEGHPFTPREFS